MRKNEVFPETDVVVAASLVARAVDSGFRAKPVIFCKGECCETAKACCEPAGLRTVDDLRPDRDVP